MSAAYCLAAPRTPLHGPYHDEEYGFPARDEAVLFERLILEINQAGRSWATIRAKRVAFRAAFANFDVGRVAAFADDDVARLMADPGIIRNRLKITATIDNARRIQKLRREYRSFAVGSMFIIHARARNGRSCSRKPSASPAATSSTSSLMSLGYLDGAHDASCPIYARIATLDPPWSARWLVPVLNLG